MNRETLQQLTAFNFSPAAYVHTTHFEEVDTLNLLPASPTNVHARRMLSEYINRYFGLSDTFFPDKLDTQTKKFIACSSKQLYNLIHAAGASCYSSQLVKIIDAEFLKDLKAAISEEAFIFGIKNGRFLFQSAVVNRRLAGSSTQMATNVKNAGLAVLYDMLHAHKEAFRDRLLLKLSLNDYHQLVDHKTKSLGADFPNCRKRLYPELIRNFL